MQCSGHFGEIIMFPPGKDPLYAGLFLPVRKAKMAWVMMAASN
jgi:hypothetical protein